jgi:3-oxoacyl-[acyl-carrier protein] reductase
MSERELDGRVALVTGGARNIGRAIALDLADGGAHVTVVARSDLKGIRATAPRPPRRCIRHGALSGWSQGPLSDRADHPRFGWRCSPLRRSNPGQLGHCLS